MGFGRKREYAAGGPRVGARVQGKHCVCGGLRPGLSSLWAQHKLDPLDPKSHLLCAACVRLPSLRLPLEAAAPLDQACSPGAPRPPLRTLRLSRDTTVFSLVTPEACTCASHSSSSTNGLGGYFSLPSLCSRGCGQGRTRKGTAGRAAPVLESPPGHCCHS